MTDVQKWILQLQSDDPNKRYEACEELRVAEQIPDEAISALHETTKDPNADVAEAAQRALGVHTVHETSTPQIEETDNDEPSTEINWGIGLLGGFLTALVIGYLAFILNSYYWPRASLNNDAVDVMIVSFERAIIIAVIAGLVGFSLTIWYLDKRKRKKIVRNQ